MENMPNSDIIKPEVAVRDRDVNWRNIKTDHAQEPYGTAMFATNTSTPWNKSNPNYKSSLKINQQSVRHFDELYDFKKHQHPNYHAALIQLNATISLSEINYHTTKLKNNKKTYECDHESDNLHTMIMKESITAIGGTLQLIFNHWKSTANITNGTNARALILYRKNEKDKHTMKSGRPPSIEKITWKLY